VPDQVPEIDVIELASALDAGAYLLDVRQPDEYAGGHVPGAVLLPLGELAGRIDDVPRDEHVYVICQSGARSARAVGHLLSTGRAATNVAGGIKAWIDEGQPVATGAGSG
jgi:rhodanese-related sulfurtransferase